MRQFTTPTLTVKISGINLTGYHTFTTLEQGANQLTLENLPVTVTESGCELTTTLTQEQTGAFDTTQRIEVQVRYINSAGTASATNIKAVKVKRVLLKGVIEYA